MEPTKWELSVQLVSSSHYYQHSVYNYTVQVKIKFLNTEGTLEPCHLHLKLPTCLIALVVVAVNITKPKKT